MAKTTKRRKIELWVTYGTLAVIAVFLVYRYVDFPNIWPWEQTVSGAKWGKILGGPKGDVISSIVALPDGGIAVAGRTESKGADNKDAWVVRLDSKGRILWDKTYGGPKIDVAASIVALPDGGLAVAGWTSSKGAGNWDAWVLRLDASGNLLWDKTFGGPKRDGAASIVVLADGGFAVAGWTSSKSEDKNGPWVLRLDSKGQLLWDRTFQGPNWGIANSIIALPDDGFALAGWVTTESVGRTNTWVMRLDAKGRQKWVRVFDGKYSNNANSIAALTNGGFAVAGVTDHGRILAGNADAWVRRLDGKGKLQWMRTYRGDYYSSANSIAALPDGGFAVAGTTSTRSTGDNDAWVRLLDGKGKLLWIKSFGGPNLDRAKAIVVLPDGGFAVAGWSCSRCFKKPTDYSAWVVRLKKISPNKLSK